MTAYYLIDDNEELLDTYEGDYCGALDYAHEIGAAYALDEQEYQGPVERRVLIQISKRLQKWPAQRLRGKKRTVSYRVYCQALPKLREKLGGDRRIERRAVQKRSVCGR